MKILIFLEHDIVIRHFIDSNVFQPLCEAHDVKFVLPEPGYKRIKQVDFKTFDPGAPFVHLAVNNDRLRVWQKLLAVSRLRWRPGRHYRAMRIFQRNAVNGNQGQWSKLVLNYTLRSLPGLYSIYKKRQFRYLETKPHKEITSLLDREQPEVVVHPCVLSGVYLDELVFQSEKRGIPLVTIMNSWDNPSTKSSVFDTPKNLLVWGPQTRNDAIAYMNMRSENVHEFGAAQFEVYFGKPRIDRNEFNRLNGLESHKTTLLFGGSSKGSDEYAQLSVLEKAIECGDLENVQVLYRPHPWGRGGKGGERISKAVWKHIKVENSMKAYLEQLASEPVDQFYADYKDTHDVLSHIDILVSPLSTIILEGALHGKPVMCFFPDEDSGAKHMSIARRMSHFDDIVAAPEVVVETGMNRLVAGIKKLLKNKEEAGFSTRLEKMCAHFVKPFEAPFGERLQAYLESMVNEKESSR